MVGAFDNPRERVAVVTGGAKGIGAATASALTADGVSVLIVDRDTTEGEKTAANLTEGLFVRGDVSSASDAERVATECVRAFGRLDILVNCAGIQRYGSVVETSEAEWDEVLAVNLKGMFLLSKFCVPKMLEGGGGTVVNVASVQGFAAQKGVAAYSASKGGAIALTRAMAVDFAPSVRVNCVCPGVVDTPMLREAAAMLADVPDRASMQSGMLSPMQRVARPEEIASAIVFLASPHASFITGAALVVDGGLLSILGAT